MQQFCTISFRAQKSLRIGHFVRTEGISFHCRITALFRVLDRFCLPEKVHFDLAGVLQVVLDFFLRCPWLKGPSDPLRRPRPDHDAVLASGLMA
jgi:hypothetical protein